MKMVLVLLIMVASIIVPSRGNAAIACAPMQPGLPGFELVVRGTISAIPMSGMMHLRASRYYKGTGPWLLVTEVQGIGQGQREDWVQALKAGDDIVIALRREGNSLHNTICNPLTIVKQGEESPRWVIDQFGPGVPPEGEEPPQDQGRRPAIWIQLIGGAAVAGLIAAGFKRYRHHFFKR